MRPIDADAFIEKYGDWYTEEGTEEGYIGTIRSLVAEAPTLSPDDVRPVGKWIRLDVHKGMEQYKCSVCETPTYVPECMNDPMYGYCPNCGARMKGAEDGTTDL